MFEACTTLKERRGSGGRDREAGGMLVAEAVPCTAIGCVLLPDSFDRAALLGAAIFLAGCQDTDLQLRGSHVKQRP